MARLEPLMQAINASLTAGSHKYDVINGYFESAGAERKINEPHCNVDYIVPTSALPGVLVHIDIARQGGYIHHALSLMLTPT